VANVVATAGPMMASGEDAQASGGGIAEPASRRVAHSIRFGVVDRFAAVLRVFWSSRKRQNAAALVTDLPVPGVRAAARTEPDCL
jgi:hypothetical protein